MKSKNFIMRFVITALAIVSSFSCMAEIKKEYHFEDDGFEWYKITTDLSNGCLRGAQDANGNIIVPPKYNTVSYDHGIQNKDGCFKVYKYEQYADGSRKKDSNGLDLDYEGVYTKDGRYIIPTDKQFRHISKWTASVGGTEKEYFQFVRGDKFNEYGICDANGKVLFMRRCDKNVYMLILGNGIYSLTLYTPEYGKPPYKCEKASEYYFDFEHNLIGTEKDSYAEMDRIGKQKNLRHPLADAPAKASPKSSSATSSQLNSSPSSRSTSASGSAQSQQYRDVTADFFSTPKTYSVTLYKNGASGFKYYKEGESTFTVEKNGYSYRFNDGSGNSHTFSPILRNVLDANDGNLQVYITADGWAVRVEQRGYKKYTVVHYVKNSNSGKYVPFEFYMLDVINN